MPTLGRTLSRLRVVVVVPSATTVRAFLRPYLSALRDAGSDVYLICGDPESLSGEPVDAVPVALPLERRLSATVVQAAVGLWRQLRRLRPDVVHLHTPAAVIVGTPVAWIARVPYRIVSIHGFVFEGRVGASRSLMRAVEQLPLNFATQCHVVSPHLGATVRASRWVRPGVRRSVTLVGEGSFSGLPRCHEPGLDEEPGGRSSQDRAGLGIAPDALVIAFVGRLDRDKGLEELLAAAEILRRERHPRLEVLVAGSADGRPETAARFRAREASTEWIHGLGWTDAVDHVYRAADVVCVPSYREGFGMVALEAQAYGVAVVASDVGGLRDAVKGGVTGVLVPPRDVPALADGLDRVLSDVDLRIRMGAAAQERVRSTFLQDDVLPHLVVELFARTSPDAT